jgi:hypothetical protein
VVGGPLVEVAAADAYIGDFQKNVFVANGGFFYFPDFDRPFFRRVVYYRWRSQGEIICDGYLKNLNVVFFFLPIRDCPLPFALCSLPFALYMRAL